MPVEEYKLEPGAFATVRKRTLLGVIPTSLIIIGIFAARYFAYSETPAQNIPGVIIAFVVIMPVMTWRLLQKQKKALDNFRLTLDGQIITTSTSAVETSITYLEVKEIRKDADGGFIISSGFNNTVVTIPGYVENKQQLETSLNAISPVITTGQTIVMRKYGIAIALGSIAVIFTFISSRNKIINLVTGPLVIGGFVWLFFKLHRYKQAQPSLARAKWLLLFDIAAFTYKLISTLGLL
jgi:hypothetical protein